jgi:glycosyltransferase involved in cell wall biosynthesis
VTKLLIVIPAFNEAQVLGKILSKRIRRLRNIDRLDVLVVNDGSRDETEKVAKKSGVIVVSHLINRGLGAALATGFLYAKTYNYDFLVTIDADGQHTWNAVERVVDTLTRGDVDVVIGSRLIGKGNMPLTRKYVNLFSNALTFLLFNIWSTDSQSGLRGFTHNAFCRIKLKSQRMEVSSEIIKEVKRLSLALREVPIESIYTRYSLHKGQKISNAPNVFWKLLLQKFA